MSILSPEHVAVTSYFIDEHPIYIIVSRSPLVATGTGGFTRGAPVLLPPQKVRKVGLAGQPRNFVGDNGATIFAEATVIAPHDADLEAGDHFTTSDDDTTWEVLGVNIDPPWRKEVSVARRG